MSRGPDTSPGSSRLPHPHVLRRPARRALLTGRASQPPSVPPPRASGQGEFCPPLPGCLQPRPGAWGTPHRLLWPTGPGFAACPGCRGSWAESGRGYPLLRTLGRIQARRAAPVAGPVRPLPRTLRTGGGDTCPFLQDLGVGAPRSALASLFNFVYSHFPTFRLVSRVIRSPASRPLSWPACCFVGSGCRLTSAQRFLAS